MLSLESASASLARAGKAAIEIAPLSTATTNQVLLALILLLPVLERLCEAVLDAELDPRVVARGIVIVLPFAPHQLDAHHEVLTRIGEQVDRCVVAPVKRTGVLEVGVVHLGVAVADGARPLVAPV